VRPCLTPRRELLHVADLAELVSNVTGFEGGLRFDTSKPDGTPIKCLDVSRINNLGGTQKSGLRKVLKKHTSGFPIQL